MSVDSPDDVAQLSDAPASATDAPAVTPVTETAAPDAQSASAQDEGKQSLLEAVLEALPEETTVKDDKIELPGVTSDADSKKPEPDKPDDSKPLDPQLTKAEFEAYPERTRQRIQQLLTERESFRVDADVARGLRNYLTAVQIDREGLEALLDLGAAMRRGDFEAFLAGVAPYVELAEQATGRRIAPELMRDVQTGHMSSEAAARMTSERISRQIAEGKAHDYEAGRNLERVQQQTHQMQTAIAGAVNNWEQQAARSDPDFSLKQRAAKDLLWSVLRETGTPTNPQQAVQVAQEAYRRAEGYLRSAQPAPRSTARVPSSAHRSNGAMPEPKTLMEAALQGLARSRA